MSGNFKEDHIELLMSEIIRPDMTCTGREEYWRNILELVKLGASRKFKENQSHNLLQLIFSPECEETTTVRCLSLNVLYQLMICDSTVINGMLRQVADELFQHLIYAFVSDSANLKLTAENCLMRLLMSIMNPIDAFYVVIQYFSTAEDLRSPDICKLMLWTVEGIQKTQLSQEMLSQFIDGLKKQYPNASNSGDFTIKHRLKYICDRLSLKTGSHFGEIVRQILKTKPKSKSKEFQDTVLPTLDSFNKYNKIQPIPTRPRSAGQPRNTFRF